MKTIFLHGKLGEVFGKEWKLDVNSPLEALRAICANRPNFHKYLLEKNSQGVNYVFKAGSKYVNKKEVALEDDLKCYNIIPAPAGAGVETLLIGVLLAAAAAVVTYMIFSQSKPPRPEDPVQKSSYLFNGATNATSQGNFVPIGYGRLVAGSAVISSSSLAAPMKQITTKTPIKTNIINANIE